MAAQVAETLAQKHQVTVVAGRPSYDPDEYYPFALLQPRHTQQRDSRARRFDGLSAPQDEAPRLELSLVISRWPFRAPLAIQSGCGAGDDRSACRGNRRRLRRHARGPAVRLQHPRHVSRHGRGRRHRAPSGCVRRVWERMHRWALRKAARVIVLGDDMRDRISPKASQPERVVDRSRRRHVFSEVRCRRSPIRSCRKFAAAFRLSCCTPAISVFTAPGTLCSRPPKFSSAQRKRRPRVHRRRSEPEARLEAAADAASSCECTISALPACSSKCRTS